MTVLHFPTVLRRFDLNSRIRKLLAALVAAATILMGTFFYGRKAQRTDDRVEDLEEYFETTEIIDAVEVSDDPDAAIKRLRDNGWTG